MGYLRRKLRRSACRQQIRDAYRRTLPTEMLRWVLASPEPPREPGVFLRLCTDRIDPDSHEPQGVFTAAYELRRSPELPADDRKLLTTLLTWFGRNLPSPKDVPPRSI